MSIGKTISPDRAQSPLDQAMQQPDRAPDPWGWAEEGTITALQDTHEWQAAMAATAAATAAQQAVLDAEEALEEARSRAETAQWARRFAWRKVQALKQQ